MLLTLILLQRPLANAPELNTHCPRKAPLSPRRFAVSFFTPQANSTSHTNLLRTQAHPPPHSSNSSCYIATTTPRCAVVTKTPCPQSPPFRARPLRGRATALSGLVVLCRLLCTTPPVASQVSTTPPLRGLRPRIEMGGAQKGWGPQFPLPLLLESRQGSSREAERHGSILVLADFAPPSIRPCGAVTCPPVDCRPAGDNYDSPGVSLVNSVYFPSTSTGKYVVTRPQLPRKTPQNQF